MALLTIERAVADFFDEVGLVSAWTVSPGRTVTSVTTRARMPNVLKAWLLRRIPVDDAFASDQNRYATPMPSVN